jgi:hypothetical protein
VKFKCEIDNIRTLKKGMKLTLQVDDKQTKELMKQIYNFMDKPITVELLIDEQEQIKRFQQITPEQRKKIYAILRDMESYIGDSVENLKESTKASFIRATEWEDFSLSNCSKELAADYIEYLIIICFEMGVPLKDSPIDAFDDVDRYLYLCLSKRVCAVCGRPGEVHHVDVIGMGRDRRTYDDSDHRKMCLCRKHHSEAHQIGMDAFQGKYHVYGIIWEG